MADKGSEKNLCIQKKLLFSDEVTPEWLREPFIKSGYRQAYLTAWQCLQSLFYLHNQTFNIWSHYLASLYFLVRFGIVLTGSDSLQYPMNFPVISAAIVTVVVYSTSATAHLFNCISKKTYKTGFVLDYAAISVYTFTSTQVMFFYTRPLNTNWLIFQSPYLYFSTAALLAFLATYSCCKTGARNGKFSTLLRTLPFLATWLTTALPFTTSVTFCTCHATISSRTRSKPARRSNG